MVVIITLLLMLCLSHAVPADPAVVPSAGYGYAFEVAGLVNATRFACMKKAGYNVVFVNAFYLRRKMARDAAVKELTNYEVALANIQNAHKG
ncbi:hypothetical protein OESDEN_16981 [Oesophagostomum dentatum]|uniref:Uncharacterized protein n=1 Tax=Oesophagostomum dentatum TaxID=61180 RepID=A0A0B1SIF3_OESDE|nr:hypothetical protein OESDEN_16981 [Oesophagostomum dentatum]